MSDTDTEKIQTLKIDVELLKKDVSQSQYFLQKITDSIEKIQEINSNLVKMITLHEEKHDQAEKTENDIKEQLKELHKRIDQLETHIERKFDVLRSDLIVQKEEKKSFRDSMKEIDRYKWMIGGAAIAIIWIINHVNLSALEKLFK